MQAIVIVDRDGMELTLLCASDDPAQLVDELPAEVIEVYWALKKVRRFIDPAVRNFGGEFLSTLGPPAIADAAAVAGAWVNARYGRKVRLKVGDVEAEGSHDGRNRDIAQARC